MKHAAPDDYQRSLEKIRAPSEKQDALIAWLSVQTPETRLASTPLIHWQNSIPILHWLVNQCDIDKTNAAWIFWSAQPDCYADYIIHSTREICDDGSFAIACDVLENWRSRLYKDHRLGWPEPEGIATYGCINEYKRRIIHPISRDPFDLPLDIFGPFPGKEAIFPDELSPYKNCNVHKLFDELGVYLFPRN